MAQIPAAGVAAAFIQATHARRPHQAVMKVTIHVQLLPAVVLAILPVTMAMLVPMMYVSIPDSLLHIAAIQIIPILAMIQSGAMEQILALEEAVVYIPVETAMIVILAQQIHVMKVFYNVTI